MKDLDKTDLKYLKNNFKKIETETSTIYKNDEVEIEIVDYETVILQIKGNELEFNSIEDCIAFLRV